ncbi:MAG: GGDEF domain-containing protein [Nitrospiraceae bacterium]|jgi:diguanylate cyclase (GGDEF)-like protein/PAS domain S-box-containing protein|nr:GGDEF domain-containing protein [Nitrospiraceae bacterium]
MYWFVIKTALLGAASVLAPLVVFRLTAHYQAQQGLVSLGISLLVASAFAIPVALLVRSTLAFVKQYQEAIKPPAPARHTIQMLDAYLDPFKALMDSTKDSVYLLGRDGRFLFVNKTHLDRMGLQEHEVVGRYYQDIHSPEEWIRTESVLNRVLRNNVVAEEEYQSSRDGGYYLQTMAPVQDDKGRLSAVLVTSKDISERHQFEDRMKTWAMQDELTGLLNRRGFLFFAEQQQSVARRLGRKLLLLFMDMDNLKTINDTLGHELGDAAIQEMAQVMNETFRKADILARIGGDEFAVLAFETTTGYAETLQSRLLQTVLTHNARKGRKFDVSMSVGAVIWDPASSETIEDVLTTADKLMYEQKMQKKGRKK